MTRTNATGALLARRRRLLGPSLSLSYRTPLHIVRGAGAHLFDPDGRAYLDCVNNVAHVGHAHPRVVEAGAAQMRSLNTNTRYLHESVVRYAERLTALLPGHLEVAFFTDAGVAWTSDLTPRVFGKSGDRPWVRSVGAALRFNAFGYLIGEIDYVKPLDRPDKGWDWQFNFVPGF